MKSLKYLLKFNFHQNSQNLIKNYLRGREQAMKVNGHITNTLKAKRGFGVDFFIMCTGLTCMAYIFPKHDLII